MIDRINLCEASAPSMSPLRPAERELCSKIMRPPPEPATPPIKEPANEPEDSHALQEPDPDPVRPAQI
jgi:hypothetical protein